jgi:hemolysin activation/secretion protein
MRQLQREIILYYRAHDRPLVDVLYPEQDVSNGMLQVIVIEGRLKEVVVQDKKGNRYTNGWSGVKFLHDSFRLRTNDIIRESEVVRDLDWLNRNPFRYVDAVYEPDRREYGESSLLLRVDEQREWSADVGYEDSGNRITSDDRITVGGTWGRAFTLPDNQFRYAFTFDPTLDFLRAHSASYYAPLPWHHGLRLSGYYLDVKGDVGPNETLNGSAYQISGRYEVPLPSIRKYQQEFSVGLDFKHNDNSLVFGVATPFNTPYVVFQAAGGYSSVLPDPWGKTAFGVQGYWSPGGISGLNDDPAFNLARPGAKSSYAYGRFNLERTFRLPGDFSWIIRGLAQVANGNLVTTEQLGLGGYATVRGYDELESLGDRGFFMSNELRTPPFSPLHLARKNAPVDEKLQLLTFWDYGETQNVQLLAGEDPHVLLSSVGGGLRYSLTKHLSLRFDYGWQLVKVTGSHEPSNSRSHIGVVATF